MVQARPPHKQRQGAPPDWEDPAVFGRHRLPSHVPLHSFADPTHARLFWQQHKGSAAARYDARVAHGSLAARLCDGQPLPGAPVCRGRQPF
jgi:hypothetical protein